MSTSFTGSLGQPGAERCEYHVRPHAQASAEGAADIRRVHVDVPGLDAKGTSQCLSDSVRPLRRVVNDQRVAPPLGHDRKQSNRIISAQDRVRVLSDTEVGIGG